MLSYGKISKMLYDQRHAGNPPDKAAEAVLEQIGPRKMREALLILLTMDARKFDPLPKPTAQPVLAEAAKGSAELYREKVREARNLSQERSKKGLPPLVYYAGDFRTEEVVVQMRAAEKERRARRKEVHATTEKGRKRVDVEIAIMKSVETYAIESYGDKIWTGIRWVQINDADKDALLGAIAYHEGEADAHEAEAKYHRAQADRLRRLAAVLPEGGKVSDLEPEIMQGLAA